MMNKIVKKILRKLHLVEANRQFREQCWHNDAWMIDEYHLPELTNSEVELFKQTWPCFPSVDKRDLTYLRMYKHVYGFNPYYLPDFQFYEYIIKKTNPSDLVKPFENKAMYDIYLSQLPIAKTLSKAINGKKFNGINRIINDDEELNILCTQRQFIIKPSKETGCGKGVKKVNLEKIQDKTIYLKKLLENYGSDYVVQEVIEQHPSMGNLNPTSLNTCRVTTMYFDGKISSSTILKVGKLNADKDNWFTSYFIGVSQEGKVLDYGFDAKLRRVTKTDNGTKFGGLQLPEYRKMISTVEYFHQLYFPMIGVLGWDVVVDKDNNIRVIEVNVDYPGIAGEQFASGPFFKERRDDIIEVLMKK